MPFMRDHQAAEPARSDVDAQAGWLLIEFGAPWCGHCQAAQAFIAKALADRTGISHLKIEDGPGRPRSSSD